MLAAASLSCSVSAEPLFTRWNLSQGQSWDFFILLVELEILGTEGGEPGRESWAQRLGSALPLNPLWDPVLSLPGVSKEIIYFFNNT